MTLGKVQACLAYFRDHSGFITRTPGDARKVLALLATSENAPGRAAPPPFLGKYKRVLITSQGFGAPRVSGVH